MPRYYKVIECDHPYEGGEVAAACNASSRKQADRRLRVSEEQGGNGLAYLEPSSRLAFNIYDPKGLTLSDAIYMTAKNRR